MSETANVNLCAVLHKRREEKPCCDIVLEKRTIKEPNDNEVLIKIYSVGICGSDVCFWKNAEMIGLKLETPTISGHEASGTVVKCGKDVSHLKAGDRVAIEPCFPLCSDEFSRCGRYNLSQIYMCSGPGMDGALQQYLTHRADACFKLPENVSFEEGALVEPLSVGIHACRRAEIGLGHRVLICGAGPIGLVSLIAAKAMGASDVIITDKFDYRLQKAKELGANFTIKIKEGDEPQGVAKTINELLGAMPDRSILCTGADSAVQTAIYATKAGGCVVLVGFGSGDARIPLVHAAVREIDIKGSFLYTNTWPAAIKMISSGKIDVKPLITHRIPIEKAQEAFQLADGMSAIKIIIKCNPDDQNN
uniref:sorbitol dehydrogenase-like n=1 Tax=Styela clava TaxID=7725 RepID=UPI0019399E69|nr:sorbitol dehydrogenase-like [Styela clava]